MSKIALIEARALAPAVDRFRYTSFSDEVYTTTTLVRITDEHGIWGIGAYDADSFGDWSRAPLETLRTLLPAIVGMDADDREGVSTLLTEDGTSPFPPAVRSTIDIALWDLAARAAGTPLHVLLGGAPANATLPSYASVPLYDDEHAYLEAVGGYVARGFGAVKLHAWGAPSRDAALIRAVRAPSPRWC